MKSDVMRLAGQDPGAIATEEDACREMVPLAAARVLELGCGRADITRKLAGAYPDARFTALETDAIQAALNVPDPAVPNVRFGSGAAEDIPAGEGDFDAVLMFKSLHHVPAASLDRALAEIHRVLAPGGAAFFCEPVFAGEYNEVLRIFHDEERVRSLAFEALRRAAASGRFELAEERFFRRRLVFKSFAQFEKNVIGVTHTQHRLTPGQHARVRERFVRSETPQGIVFEQPMRVDLLRRAA
jgi:ubiquinone/menaquinone biosynthesis C-methylase UbiE